MEKNNGAPEFQFVNRSVGVPLNRAAPPTAARTERASAPEEQPESTLPRPALPRLHMPEGEPRLTLIQIVAAVLLLLTVGLGLSFGGDAFRGAYQQLTTRNEWNLSGLFGSVATSSEAYSENSSGADEPSSQLPQSSEPDTPSGAASV